MGLQICVGRSSLQGEVGKSEAEEQLRRKKIEKSLIIDGITAEMLKYRGETVLEWMMWICNLAWQQGEVPEQSRKVITVLLYCCSDYNRKRGISLLTVYGRVLSERNIRITEENIGTEQGGFRKGDLWVRLLHLE